MNYRGLTPANNLNPVGNNTLYQNNIFLILNPD